MKVRTVLAVIVAGALTLALAGCGGNDEATPTLSATTTLPSPTVPKPTATLSPEAEVLAAYANYWDVYIQALRDRDDSRLGEVMTGPRLERGLREIADLHSQGRAVELVLGSNPVVLEIRGDLALISDEYENNSYYIDPITKKPMGATSTGSETLKDLITLQRVDGVWKVRDGVREEPNQ